MSKISEKIHLYLGEVMNCIFEQNQFLLLKKQTNKPKLNQNKGRNKAKQAPEENTRQSQRQKQNKR